MTDAIPFNRPHHPGEEIEIAAEALRSGWTGGNGPFTQACEQALQELTGSARVLLTSSCTGALEMAAILAGVGPGDEVVMPSYTFASTATAFVLRGATPVFVDIDEATLSIDSRRAAEAIGPRTRALVVVHYAGACADMEALSSIAAAASLLMIEDAAQAVGSQWKGRALGTFGALGAFSFHETKNVTCGEGGALLVNDERFAARAEVLQEKGTNRAQFARGEVDRYRWMDLGSSWLMPEASAAMLSLQLGRLEAVTAARLRIWSRYHERLAPLEEAGRLRRPRVLDGCRHNAHIYPILLGDPGARDQVAAQLGRRGISAYFHYTPLHSSPAGQRYARVAGPMTVTDRVAGSLLRLPLWFGMTEGDADRVCDALAEIL